ncbi:MAG: SRPBCC domain-containing protein, partial [Actinobacteria bacterium]|nr:SRPBCC domain-containing protein [Actinomycetota bacterium]
YLVNPAKLASWQVDRVIALNLRRNGGFRLQTSDGRAVVGRFLEVLPGRRLVMTWGYEHSAELPPEGSTVEITLMSRGDRTVLHLLHRSERLETTNGGMEMASCEWCGRVGREVQLHVRSEDKSVEFGVPVLCDVCSGLVGFFSDPETPRPDDPGFREFMDRRVDETQRSARDQLFRFLSDNYAKKGKPVPAFMVQSGEPGSPNE